MLFYDDAAICDYPQSGERIVGQENLQALRSHHPGHPSGFTVKRILGWGRSLDYGIHDHLRGANCIHSEHYGVPQRQGRSRDTILRGFIRGAGMGRQWVQRNA